MWHQPGEGSWHLLSTFSVLGTIQNIFLWNNNDNIITGIYLALLFAMYEMKWFTYIFSFNPHNDSSTILVILELIILLVKVS